MAALIVACTIAGNTCLLGLIASTRDMYNKHFLLIVITSINDMLIALTYIPAAISLLVMDKASLAPQLETCIRVSSCLLLICLMAQVFMSGTLSLER